MKKSPLLILSVFLASLCLMVAAAWLAPGISRQRGSVCALCAVLFCLLAIVCHITAHKKPSMYILGYLVNGLSSGFAIGILYVEKVWTPDLVRIGVAALIPAVLALCCICIFFRPDLPRSKSWLILFLVLTGLYLAAAVAIWIWKDALFGSFALFSGLFLLVFPVYCWAVADAPRELWRYLSFSGFWAFALILFAVLLILSDGDALEYFDGWSCTGSPTSKKGKKFSPKDTARFGKH